MLLQEKRFQPPLALLGAVSSFYVEAYLWGSQSHVSFCSRKLLMCCYLQVCVCWQQYARLKTKTSFGGFWGLSLACRPDLCQHSCRTDPGPDRVDHKAQFQIKRLIGKFHLVDRMDLMALWV